MIGLIGSVNWLGVFTRPFWRAISTSVEFSVAFPVDCEARYNHRIRKGWVLRMLWGIFFNFYKFGELMRTFIASNYCQGKLLRKKSSTQFHLGLPFHTSVIFNWSFKLRSGTHMPARSSDYISLHHKVHYQMRSYLLLTIKIYLDHNSSYS